MGTDLSRIPGAGPSKKRRPAPRLAAPALPSLSLPRGRKQFGRPPRSIPWSWIVIVLGFLILGVYLWSTFWRATRVGLEISGLADDAQITLEEAATLEVDIRVPFDERAPEPTLLFDGVDADPASVEIEEGRVRWTPQPLVEGDHQLQLKVGRPLLDEATFTWSFTVDGTPPVFDIESPLPASPVCEPVRYTAGVEPGATVWVDGEEVDIDEQGRFTLAWPQPPTGPVTVKAADAAGNETNTEIVVPVAYPSSQAIHVSAAAFGYKPLHDHVMDLIDRGLVSAVELDLKDEAGIVGYDSDVDLAEEIGAERPEYQLDEALAELDAKGVRVIGRIVVFRDAPLATWAWANGKKDWVVQTADGQPLSNYGGFTNVGAPEVRQYNIDIAMDAIDRGVDEVLWDYVRRPEGALDSMHFAGIDGSPSPYIVQFLSEAAGPIREACAYQGASVFGVAAQTPEAISQSIPSMARHLDYIAPMLYPSHWVRGEYDVDHPNAQPYDIVHAALADFQRQADGSGVAFSVWVQDFSIGIPYTPEMVRAQIDAAADLGVRNWLLWNAKVQYSADALDPSIADRPDGSEVPASG